jgi:hypothetical protein
LDLQAVVGDIGLLQGQDRVEYSFSRAEAVLRNFWRWGQVSLFLNGRNDDGLKDLAGVSVRDIGWYLPATATLPFFWKEISFSTTKIRKQRPTQ